jgi:hypothetical protein
MRRRHPYWVFIIGLAVFLPALLLQARVFRSGGWGPGRTVFMAGEFGKRLYRTVMQINGDQAEVSVVLCREGMEAVGGSVMAGQGVSARFAASETLGMGEITGMGRQVRLVAIAPDAAKADVVLVAVEQTQRGPSASRGLPLKHGLLDLPPLPGGQVTAFLKNEDTRVAWETVTTESSPASVASFYEANLKQAGWTPVLPYTPSADGGMLCCVRGGDICCVRVRRTDSDGETQVALLHKQGALK